MSHLRTAPLRRIALVALLAVALLTVSASTTGCSSNGGGGGFSIGGVQVTPTSLDFGTVDVGTSATLVLTFQNLTAIPATVTVDGNISAGGPTFAIQGATLTGTIPASSSVNVTIEYTPPDGAAHTGNFNVEFTGVSGSPLNVPLNGQGNVPPGTLAVSDGSGPITSGSTINVGSILDGSGNTASHTFTLTSPGLGAVDVTDTSLSTNPTGQFVLSGDTAPPTQVLAPLGGSSANLTVDFTQGALTPGTHTATLSITWDNGTGPTVFTINLTAAIVSIGGAGLNITLVAVPQYTSVGAAMTAKMTVTNSGSSSQQVTAATLHFAEGATDRDADYAVVVLQGVPATIAPAGSADIYLSIQVSATATYTFGGSFTISGEVTDGSAGIHTGGSDTWQFVRKQSTLPTAPPAGVARGYLTDLGTNGTTNQLHYISGHGPTGETSNRIQTYISSTWGSVPAAVNYSTNGIAAYLASGGRFATIDGYFNDPTGAITGTAGTYFNNDSSIYDGTAIQLTGAAAWSTPTGGSFFIYDAEYTCVTDGSVIYALPGGISSTGPASNLIPYALRVTAGPPPVYQVSNAAPTNQFYTATGAAAYVNSSSYSASPYIVACCGALRTATGAFVAKTTDMVWVMRDLGAWPAVTFEAITTPVGLKPAADPGHVKVGNTLFILGGQDQNAAPSGGGQVQSGIQVFDLEHMIGGLLGVALNNATGGNRCALHNGDVVSIGGIAAPAQFPIGQTYVDGIDIP